MTTKCPKCGAYLSKNESLLGNCVSCGATFENKVAEKSSVSNTVTRKNNTVAKCIRGLGIGIIVAGTFIAIGVANGNDSVGLFFVTEIASIISGILLIGMAEIIQLLEDIKNK